MIKEQFLYFAQFPAKEGVNSILTNGSASTPGYTQLLNQLSSLPSQERVPEIQNYVYGQSFDELKQRIDRLIGSFLFVDYGEFDMSADSNGSLRLTQQMAITVAIKMPNRADAAEHMLASDTTLHLLSRVHAWMLADADREQLTWISRDSLHSGEIVPFVASELNSVGWTLIISCIGSDTLDTHQLYRSFLRQTQ